MSQQRPSRSKRNDQIAAAWGKPQPPVDREVIAKQCADARALLMQSGLTNKWGEWIPQKISLTS